MRILGADIDGTNISLLTGICASGLCQAGDGAHLSVSMGPASRPPVNRGWGLTKLCKPSLASLVALLVLTPECGCGVWQWYRQGIFRIL